MPVPLAPPLPQSFLLRTERMPLLLALPRLHLRPAPGRLDARALAGLAGMGRWHPSLPGCAASPGESVWPGCAAATARLKIAPLSCLFSPGAGRAALSNWLTSRPRRATWPITTGAARRKSPPGWPNRPTAATPSPCCACGGAGRLARKRTACTWCAGSSSRCCPAGETWQYGDRLLLSGSPVDPPETRDFSYRDYLARQGIYTYLAYPRVAALEGRAGSPLLAAIYALRERAHSGVAGAFPAARRAAAGWHPARPRPRPAARDRGRPSGAPAPRTSSPSPASTWPSWPGCFSLALQPFVLALVGG